MSSAASTQPTETASLSLSARIALQRAIVSSHRAQQRLTRAARAERPVMMARASFKAATRMLRDAAVVL